MILVCLKIGPKTIQNQFFWIINHHVPSLFHENHEVWGISKHFSLFFPSIFHHFAHLRPRSVLWHQLGALSQGHEGFLRGALLRRSFGAPHGTQNRHGGHYDFVPGRGWWCLSWCLHFLSGYGSIPISTIFRVMNIHLPAILRFTRGTRFWPIPIHENPIENNWNSDWTMWLYHIISMSKILRKNMIRCSRSAYASDQRCGYRK